MPRKPTYAVDDIGPKLRAARAAGRPWSELEEVFGLERHTLMRYLRRFEAGAARKPAPQLKIISLQISL